LKNDLKSSERGEETHYSNSILFSDVFGIMISLIQKFYRFSF